MFRLASLDQAGDKAEAEMVRNELIEQNLALVEPLAKWFRRHWQGCDPTPTVDESSALATGGFAGPCAESSQAAMSLRQSSAGHHPWPEKTAFREHIMARLPVVKDAAGNAHQTIMMQLEYGEQADGRNKKGEGGIIWKGYDGLIVPVPAGEPRSQPKPLASTSRRRSLRGLENPDGRRAASADPDLQLKETVESLLHTCKTEVERRVVEMLANAKTRRESRKRLGCLLRLYRDISAHRRAVQKIHRRDRQSVNDAANKGVGDRL